MPDPRRDQGRRHPHAFVLSLAACAVLAGAKSLATIAEWAADAPPNVLARLGGPCREPGRGPVAPAGATVRRVLQRIDGDALLPTGISWEHLPQELGFGSGMTCWRPLAEWTEAGVWSRLHEVLFAEFRNANALDFLPGGRRRLPHRRVKSGAKTGQSPVAGRAAGAGQTLPAPATAGRGAGRSGLRPRQVPPPGLGPRGEASDRSPWYRAQFRTGHSALCRRAHVRPPALVPPSTHPLVDTRRHARSLPKTRVRVDLLESGSVRWAGNPRRGTSRKRGSRRINTIPATHFQWPALVNDGRGLLAGATRVTPIRHPPVRRD
ncbi:transposase family protein [Streptomyces sp. NBC_01171]|nr:transposase family protein [Streptomyces sp. NBC_01171]